MVRDYFPEILAIDRRIFPSMEMLSAVLIRPQLERLERDLTSGDWERRNAELRHRLELDVGYRLVIAERRCAADITLPHRDG